MQTPADYLRLSRYLDGEASPEEEIIVRAWIEQDPEAAAWVEDVRAAEFMVGETLGVLWSQPPIEAVVEAASKPTVASSSSGKSGRAAAASSSSSSSMRTAVATNEETPRIRTIARWTAQRWRIPAAFAAGALLTVALQAAVAPRPGTSVADSSPDVPAADADDDADAAPGNASAVDGSDAGSESGGAGDANGGDLADGANVANNTSGSGDGGVVDRDGDDTGSGGDGDGDHDSADGSTGDGDAADGADGGDGDTTADHGDSHDGSGGSDDALDTDTNRDTTPLLTAADFKPVDLAVEPTDEGVMLTWWLPNTVSGFAARFAIYRQPQTAPGLPFLRLGEIVANRHDYLDRSARAGETYRYRVITLVPAAVLEPRENGSPESEGLVPSPVADSEPLLHGEPWEIRFTGWMEDGRRAQFKVIAWHPGGIDKTTGDHIPRGWHVATIHVQEGTREVDKVGGVGFSVRLIEVLELRINEMDVGEADPEDPVRVPRFGDGVQWWPTTVRLARYETADGQIHEIPFYSDR